MLEGEGIQQDANTEESSAASQTSTESQTEVTASGQSESESQSAPQAKPFHEDPKVQEYIQRQVAKQAAQYERQMAEIQRQMQEQLQPKQPKAKHPFIENLRQIDPQYAAYIEDLEAKASKVEQIESRQTAREAQDLIQKYESSIERLHAENKVPTELQARIKREVDAAVRSNPELSLKDIPQLYKDTLEDYNKWIDGIKRAERASYVKDKSKDAQVPTSQPKGAPATPNAKRPVHTDREAMLASVVKNALKRSKAESEI